MRKNMFSKFCVLLFTLTALCSIDAISQIPEYLPRNGLVGWWPLNGNATDESGNGNDGVVYGAKSQKNRFDQPASSLELNGKSDYIVMKKNGPLGSDSRTVSVWVKTNDVSTSIIVSWGYGSEGSDFNLWSNYSCNGITLDINHSAKTYNSKFTNGDWNHYVVVYDKSIGSKLSAVVVYENGKVLDSKCAETGYGVINTGLGFPITLGKYHARNSEYLEGIIDDLAVWNRSLTPIEVSELYYSSNNPDKNKVNPITLDDKSDLIKSENEHKGVNKGTTNYYDTDLDTTNANKDNQLEVVLQFPKYIVCEESEYYNFDKESLFGDEGAPGGLRFFTVAIDRFGNKKKLDTNSSFLEQHVLLFEVMSGDPEKKRIPDFYKTIGNYWKPDIAQSGDKDVRELNKKLQNKYFRLVLVPISCESQYDENGLALEYKRDMKGNIIPGTRPKGKTEVRYYVKSIEEVTIITKSLGISNKDKGVLSTILPIPFKNKDEEFNETVTTILKKLNSSKAFNYAKSAVITDNKTLSEKKIDKFYYNYDGYDFLDNQIEVLRKSTEVDRLDWKYIFSKKSRIPTEIMHIANYSIQDDCSNQIERGTTGLCTINIYFTLTNKMKDTLLFPLNKGYNSLLDSLHTGLFTYVFHKNQLLCINYKNERMTGSSIRPDGIQYAKKIMNLLTKELGKPKAWYGLNSIGGELVEYYYDLGKSSIVISGVRRGYYAHQKKDPFRIENISYISKKEENRFIDSTMYTRSGIIYSDGESTATPWFNYLYSKEKRHQK